ANRFDQLPIRADGGELVLDRIVGWSEPADRPVDSSVGGVPPPNPWSVGGVPPPNPWLPAADPEPLREAAALAQLPVVAATGVGARHLPRRDDRIVLFPALWAVGDLHAQLPGDVPVGSPDFVAGLTSLLKAPPPLRRKWERLAQLVREAEPKSPLARWLEDFARDSGIGRLQRLIVDHVSQHGLKQLLDHVRVSAEELWKAVRRLPRKRPAPAGKPGPSADDVRQAVDGLYDVYTALKAEYEQSAPELTVTLEGRPVSLQQRVYDQVTLSVFEWPVWNELL